MLEKKINEFVFDKYNGLIKDSYDDVLHHPESEYREEELDALIDQVYRTGFRDGIKFMEWLSRC